MRQKPVSSAETIARVFVCLRDLQYNISNIYIYRPMILRVIVDLLGDQGN